MTVSCPECGRELSNPGALRMHMKSHGKNPELGRRARSNTDITSPGEPVSPLDQDTPPASILGDDTPAEPAPSKPKRSLKDRLLGSKPPPPDDRPKSPRETRPATPRPRRVDASRMLGDGWGYLGRLLERKLPAYTPAARAIQAESAAAGPIVADLVRDTIADRPVQFAARHYEAGSVAVSLFALPAYVQRGGAEILSTGTISADTRRRIEECVVDIAPSMVKWAKREAKRRQDVETALEEMRDVLGLPEGQPVTFDHLLGFFYPMEEAGPPGTIPADARVA